MEERASRRLLSFMLGHRAKRAMLAVGGDLRRQRGEEKRREAVRDEERFKYFSGSSTTAEHLGAQ